MINKFMGEYRFLSNFHLAPVFLFGDYYPSVEHGYQAAKTHDRNLRKPFQDPQMKPAEAKRAGNKLPLRSDWEFVKSFVMLTAVRDKFRRHPYLGQLLLDTGNEELVEGNTWGDTCWGVCNGVGENRLGKILMIVREELRNANTTTNTTTV